MRIVGLVSHSPGHLDFGGGGFLRLAEQLRGRGHDFSWIAGPPSAEVLVGHGWDVAYVSDTRSVAGSALIGRSGRAWEVSCRTLTELRLSIQSIEPHLLLVDRCLSVAGPLLETLGLPFAAIGAPGGLWHRTAEGVSPTRETLETFRETSARLNDAFEWFNGDFDSEWLRSPSLNITFLGKSFYPQEARNSSSAFVNLFEPGSSGGACLGTRLGFAFGRTGEIEILGTVLDDVLAAGSWAPDQIDLLLGGRPDGLADFQRFASSGLALHGWCDYRSTFPGFCGLVTYGGIGTLWHSIDNNLPSLVAPSSAGDQAFNARAVAREGLGLFFDGTGPAPVSLLRDLGKQGLPFERFKDPANFSDDLDTICDRIEGLVGFC